MVAWGGTKAVGMAIGNQKVIGGAWKGQKFKFQTVFEWSGACRIIGSGSSKAIWSPRNSAARLPAEWIVGGTAAYLASIGAYSFPTLESSNGTVQLWLASTVNTSGGAVGPQLISELESSLRIEFIHATAGTLVITGTGSDTDEPYTWVPPNSAAVRAWVNAVNNGDNVRVRFIL